MTNLQLIDQELSKLLEEGDTEKVRRFVRNKVFECFMQGVLLAHRIEAGLEAPTPATRQKELPAHR